MTAKKNRFQLEKEITDIIFNDNGCSTHFQWGSNNESNSTQAKYQLNLVTYNPIHKTQFLLHTITEEIGDIELLWQEKEEIETKILRDMLYYLQQRKKHVYYYTVKWSYKKDDSNAGEEFKENVSYFNGNDIQEIINKFFFQKDKDTIIIYSIIMSDDPNYG